MGKVRKVKENSVQKITEFLEWKRTQQNALKKILQALREDANHQSLSQTPGSSREKR